MLLPESPIFDFLEGLIPHPSQTYDRIIQIIEDEENEKINKEIANRRSRLGAVKGKVSLEVKREVLGISQVLLVLCLCRGC
jgi:superkiller protein 3